jgi:chromate reductase
MSSKKVRILGFAGSLRKGSYNKMALQIAAKVVPDGAELEVFDLEGIPPFNQDLEQNPPSKVKEFKNAVDWASRPYGDNAFDGKPIALMGATIGNIGTARAQYHLRQSFVFLNMFPLNQPEVMIPEAQGKFDEDGNLKDEHTREKIKELLQALVEWTRKLKR